MFSKELINILNIKYPIIQGAMAWISESNLASAVSNAGGLGVIAAGNADGELVRSEIRKTKQLTDKPFAVNIMLLSPCAEEVVDVVIEEQVPVVITGAGSPEKYMGRFKEAGIIVIPVVASVLMATRMEKLGAAAVVAEGQEAGGHIGELTTMALMPQVVDSVSIPVICAGGIGDGRGLAAASMLGAKGVQVGTLFLVAKECIVHQNYKQKILEAKDTDTIVTSRSTGHPVRGLKNKFARNFVKMEKRGLTEAEIEELGVGSLRKSVVEGDTANGALMAGQIAGMIKEEKTVQEILDSLYLDGVARVKKIAQSI